jgi:hypothetical protein
MIDAIQTHNEMSDDDEGVIDFSSSSSDNDFEDSDVDMSPKAAGSSGLLGKIGGWWNKSN